MRQRTGDGAMVQINWAKSIMHYEFVRVIGKERRKGSVVRLCLIDDHVEMLSLLGQTLGSMKGGSEQDWSLHSI